jgi:RNA-directed DNA polymerase
MIRKLMALRTEMKERPHIAVSEQHQWLCQVLRGHYRSDGVIFNYRSMERFRNLVLRLWYRTLWRCSQKANRTLEWFDKLLARFPLPKPVTHQRWFGASA